MRNKLHGNTPKAEATTTNASVLHQLADECAADGASPQPAPVSGYLHLCQHIGITEFTQPIRREAGDHDPAAADSAQNCLISVVARVFLPGAFARQNADDIKKQCGKNKRKESRPNDSAGVLITVDFGQDIAKNITDRKKQCARIEGERDPEDAHAPIHDLGGSMQYC